MSEQSGRTRPEPEEISSDQRGAPETGTGRARDRRTRASPVKRRIIMGVLLGALVVAMLLNTQFLTPEEVEEITPEEFDPASTAQELYDQTQDDLVAEPLEIDVVAQALAEDPVAAAEEFDALVPSSGTTAYPVTVTGVVEEATADSLVFASDTVSTGQTTTVPLSNAIDGNLLRDLSGFQFGDAPGQTGYQRVGNELATLMRAAAEEAVGSDPSALQGEEITVQGIITFSGTEPAPVERPLVIQPIQVEAGQ